MYITRNQNGNAYGVRFALHCLAILAIIAAAGLGEILMNGKR
jgi:hypothetical protein